MIDSKPMVLDDAEAGGTGITDTEGVFIVEVTLAATGVKHSAIFTLYNNAGTPTTVITAGSGTYFSITDADTKTCVYWLTDQVYIKNQLGQTETFFITML